MTRQDENDTLIDEIIDFLQNHRGNSLTELLKRKDVIDFFLRLSPLKSLYAANANRTKKCNALRKAIQEMQKSQDFEISSSVACRIDAWEQNPNSFWEESINPLRLSAHQSEREIVHAFYEDITRRKYLIDQQIVYYNFSCVLAYEHYSRIYPSSYIKPSQATEYLRQHGVVEDDIKFCYNAILGGQYRRNFCKSLGSSGDDNIDYGPLFLHNIPAKILDNNATVYRELHDATVTHFKSIGINKWSSESHCQSAATAILAFRRKLFWSGDIPVSPPSQIQPRSRSVTTGRKRRRTTALNDAAPGFPQADGMVEANLSPERAELAPRLQHQPPQLRSNTPAREFQGTMFSTGEQCMAFDSSGTGAVSTGTDFTAATPCSLNADPTSQSCAFDHQEFGTPFYRSQFDSEVVESQSYAFNHQEFGTPFYRSQFDSEVVESQSYAFNHQGFGIPFYRSQFDSGVIEPQTSIPFTDFAYKVTDLQMSTPTTLSIQRWTVASRKVGFVIAPQKSAQILSCQATAASKEDIKQHQQAYVDVGGDGECHGILLSKNPWKVIITEEMKGLERQMPYVLFSS
ncbi:hypothetical protein PT974_07835 [Cladobotryum mycophilum]|uniref:Uncharacterized protein n=1 Tax=Cladobotryum mycophilum TaxID=491253 RepID=A0ABR0SIX6_9HYPO